jgi:DNA-binding NtrC family response regulator
LKIHAIAVAKPAALGERLADALAAAGFEVGATLLPEEIERRLPPIGCDLLLVAGSILGDPPSAGLARLRRLAPESEVVVLQAQEDGEERASLLAAGSLGVFPQGLSNRTLVPALTAFAERIRQRLGRDLAAEDRAAPLDDPEPESAPMRAVIAEADRLAAADSSVLLLGETGAGKGWLARRIHAHSRRHDAPFVTVSCGAIPDTLWESELFGHERGAFTGADHPRRGRFEVADGGTLFLDEIGETPLPLQVKLLQALERRTVRRLGGEREIEVDLRIVAATNRDLDREMKEGQFRKDLYYRLAVVTLEVPPLRERQEDIEPLARHFLGECRARIAKVATGFSRDALHAFHSYRWPGNVRELANVVERAVLLAEGEEVTTANLPLRVAATASPHPGGGSPLGHHAGWLDRPLPELRDEIVRTLERDYLRALLDRTGGHLKETARRAGIDRRSLFTKMRELGLDRDEFRRARPKLVRSLR